MHACTGLVEVPIECLNSDHFDSFYLLIQMALSAQQTRQVASARSSRKGRPRMCKLLATFSPLPDHAILLLAAFAPARISRTRAAVVVRAEAQNADALTRRAVLSAGLATAAAVSMPISFPAPAQANQLLSTEWELVSFGVSGSRCVDRLPNNCVACR